MKPPAWRCECGERSFWADVAPNAGQPVQPGVGIIVLLISLRLSLVSNVP